MCKNNKNASSLAWRLVLGATTLVLGPSMATAQLDDTWTVRVAGQTIQVNPDGTFAIPNIAAPDQFGPGGPGTAADFLSDNFLRVIGSGLVDGVPHYVESQVFQIASGQTFKVGPLSVTPDPPSLFTESISAALGQSTLTAIGATTPMQVIATLIDGSFLDVTQRSNFTVYRTSNPAVATVGPNGLVTAIGAGAVFLTATSDAATTVRPLQVIPGLPTTTVIGFLRSEDGNPVVGADVRVMGDLSATVSDAAGRFEIAAVPADDPVIIINATLDGLVGMAPALIPVAGGFTDAGIIVLEPSLGIPLENGSFETGDFTGFATSGLLRIVPNFGPLTPTDGQFMVLMDRPAPEDFDGNLLRATITLDPFLVPAGTTFLTVDFNYLTNWPHEFHFTRQGLFATLTDPTNPSGFRTIRLTPVGILELVPAPSGLGVNLMTGWLTAQIDVSSVAGSPEPCTIAFSLFHDPCLISEFASAMLVDNLRFE